LGSPPLGRRTRRERNLLAADSVHESCEPCRRERNAAEGPPERDLADLDPLADRDLFFSLEQRDLPDFLQIEPDRVLAGRRRGR
jgi:hypothetical protein